MDNNTNKYKKATRVACLLLLNSVQVATRKGEAINLSENSRLLANSHDEILDKPLYINVNQFGTITTTTDEETGIQEKEFTTLTKFRQHPLLDEALVTAFTKILANKRVGIIDEIGNLLVSATVEVSENDITYYEATDKQGKVTIRQHHSEAAKEGEKSFSIVSFKVIEVGSVTTILKTIEQLYDKELLKKGLYVFMKTHSPVAAFNKIKEFEYFPEESVVSTKEGIIKQNFSKIVFADDLPFPDDNEGEHNAAIQELSISVVSDIDSTGGGKILTPAEKSAETRRKNKEVAELLKQQQEATINEID